jgi:predicted nucleic acid-binding Zn ribbon protein
MITLEKCKEILNKGKRKYDNEEIKLIREYLYLLAELQMENEKMLN